MYETLDVYFFFIFSTNHDIGNADKNPFCKVTLCLLYLDIIYKYYLFFIKQTQYRISNVNKNKYYEIYFPL